VNVARLKKTTDPEGKPAGPGFKYFKFSDWDYVISEVFPGGGAFLGGVKAGERLLKIDDNDIAYLSSSDVQELLLGPPSETGESPMKLTLGSPYPPGVTFPPKRDVKLTRVVLRGLHGAVGIVLGTKTLPNNLYMHSVSGVTPNGPLEKSGKARNGDALVSIDGFPLFNVPLNIVQTLLSGPPTSSVTLGFVSTNFAAAADVNQYDMVTANITRNAEGDIDAVFEKFALPAGVSSGAYAFIVKSVEKGSSAGAMLREGDYVLYVGELGQNPRSATASMTLDQLQSLVKGAANTQVVVDVYRPGPVTPKPVSIPGPCAFTTIIFRGDFGDIDASVSRLIKGDETGPFIIKKVLANGASEKSVPMLRNGDILFAIGESGEPLIQCADLTQDRVKELIKGTPGTAVRLSVTRLQHSEVSVRVSLFISGQTKVTVCVGCEASSTRMFSLTRECVLLHGQGSLRRQP
jgi:C-terminal processing protease CtpA/Prc